MPNEKGFIDEFRAYVASLNVKRVLEVGSQTGELKDAVGGDGIDLNPSREDVIQANIRDFKPKKKYDLVFSSGLIEHYKKADAIKILNAMATVSNRYVLTYVPNTNCYAYMNAKKNKSNNWPKEWREELDYTIDGLAELHEQAGLEVVDKGLAGKEWAKLFGPEESEPYLCYVLARK